MFDSLYIAWQYIKYNRVKTAVLVACVTLIAFLPLSLEILLDESERQLMDRAVSTPLIVGAKGSALDLVMNSIYFDDEVPEIITMEAVDQVWDADLAVPIPFSRSQDECREDDDSSRGMRHRSHRRRTPGYRTRGQRGVVP
jgi:putative ABC transport system permease protein